MAAMTATPTLMTKYDKLHNFDQAIVHACQSLDATVEEKSKNQWIIEQLKLKPFSLLYRDYNNIVEYNALSQHDNIRDMSDHKLECKPIIPSKRLSDGKVVEPSYCANLASLAHRSPHRGMLSDRQYFELDKMTALLLNKDWTHEPHIKFGCAQVLAGSILMNVNNGETILVNSVEVYGRTKSVDIHRELSTSATFSILTTTPTYPNLWSCIQSTRDGSKLVIGTQSCDCLIISIVRLDRNEEPKVGPLSFYFAASPQHTKIFIDQDSWTKPRILNQMYQHGQSNLLIWLAKQDSCRISTIISN
ncbi:unnamed protein product [Rhizopus stolonifer]